MSRPGRCCPVPTAVRPSCPGPDDRRSSHTHGAGDGRPAARPRSPSGGATRGRALRGSRTGLPRPSRTGTMRRPARMPAVRTERRDGPGAFRSPPTTSPATGPRYPSSSPTHSPLGRKTTTRRSSSSPTKTASAVAAIAIGRRRTVRPNDRRRRPSTSNDRTRGTSRSSRWITASSPLPAVARPAGRDGTGEAAVISAHGPATRRPNASNAMTALAPTSATSTPPRPSEASDHGSTRPSSASHVPRSCDVASSKRRTRPLRPSATSSWPQPS